MFKKILFGSLAVIVLAAAAISIYNVQNAAASQPAQDTQAQGNGNGRANGATGGQTGATGQGTHGATGSQTGEPAPQNGLTEWITVTGVVGDFVAPTFTLLGDDGQSYPAEAGSANYLNTIGLVLQEGDRVTVTGFWDANGGLALKSLTLEVTGETFTFRDDLGRPAWAGGQGHGQTATQP